MRFEGFDQTDKIQSVGGYHDFIGRSGEEFSAAAVAIRTADALLIGAGAGMGVDSGLADFRGPEGFWKA